MGKRRRHVIFIRPDIRALTTAHILATFQAGRSTAFGLFLVTALPHISVVPVTSASAHFG
jgi:hypothetical protein